jgi:hypothetical protein
LTLASAPHIQRYPIHWEPIDRTGSIKAGTLEFFIMNPGPHKALELYTAPLLASPIMQVGKKSIEVRLLQYYRAGLLRRRREKRAYLYSITTEGEARLMYLWERLGYLDPVKARSDDEKELVKQRVKVCISLIDGQLNKLEQRLSATRAEDEVLTES